nr:fructosamine-3-kinase [Mycolicibacterium malmesburyense]
MAEFVKRNPSAPTGFFACEAAGLQWLSAVEGGVPCATVLGYDDTSLTLERLRTGAPNRSAAREFGRRLARTHDAGAAAFGAAPDGWDGPGFFGPMHHPLPMSLTGRERWGAFYARERLAPMVRLAADRLDADCRTDLDKVMARCDGGDFDDEDPPARLHGICGAAT